MSKVVRYSMDEVRELDVAEQLKLLAQMPDDQINTDDIPERLFSNDKGASRRKEGSRPNAVEHKKAS